MGALQNLVGRGVGFIVKNTATKKLNDKEKIETIMSSLFESLIEDKGAVILFHGSYYINKIFVKSDLLITHLEADVRDRSVYKEVFETIRRVADFSKSCGLCEYYSIKPDNSFPTGGFAGLDSNGDEVCNLVVDSFSCVGQVYNGKWDKVNIIGYTFERSVAELYINVSSGLWEHREEDLYLLYSLTDKYDIDLGNVYDFYSCA